MKTILSKFTVINILIGLISIMALFISFKIISNNYSDNAVYGKSYFLMNKHNINKSTNNLIKDNSYYIVNCQIYKGELNKDNIKYYLLDKKKYLISNDDSIIDNKQYYLVDYQSILNAGIDKGHDQSYYIKNERSIEETFKSYRITIGSYEPMYFLLSYIFSSVLEYKYFILFINSIFLLVVLLSLKKFTENYKWLYVALVLTDFYFYVYLSNIHRLKLAILFLLLSYILYNRSRVFAIFSAIISHLQIFIFYLYLAILDVIKNFNENNLLQERKKYVIYTVFILLIILLFQNHIKSKLNYYLYMEISYRVSAVILMYLIYLVIFKLEDTIKLFIPLAILVFIVSFMVGADRINFMLMEFIFIVELNRLLNKNIVALVVVIPIVLYNSYKTIDFIKVGLL